MPKNPENSFAGAGNNGGPETESRLEKKEQREGEWNLEFIDDEINYLQEAVNYLRSTEQINDNQAQKERGKIEAWKERAKQQLEEGMDHKAVQAKLRKTGNALMQRFARANVREFTKRTGTAVPFEVYDGNFSITESPDNAERIAKFIRDPDTKIRKIRSWGAALGNEGVRKIADALKDPNCNLTELAIENDGSASSTHKEGITTEGALFIAEALSVPTSKISTLSMAYNKIEEDGANAIARAIQLPHSKVARLDLSENFLEDECAHELAEVIKHSNLRTLNLWGSQFGLEGTKELAEAIKTPGSKLRELSVSMHFYGKSEEENKVIPKTKEEREAWDERHEIIIREGQENQRQGIKILLEAAHHQSSSLEKLEINNQRITDENAPDIANLIKDPNSKVIKLGLYWNEIGDDGIKVIAEALRDPNSKIKKIDLGDSHKMTKRGTQILEKLKIERPDIKIYF